MDPYILQSHTEKLSMKNAVHELKKLKLNKTKA